MVSIYEHVLDAITQCFGPSTLTSSKMIFASSKKFFLKSCSVLTGFHPRLRLTSDEVRELYQVNNQRSTSIEENDSLASKPQFRIQHQAPRKPIRALIHTNTFNLRRGNSAHGLQRIRRALRQFLPRKSPRRRKNNALLASRDISPLFTQHPK